MLKTLKSDFTRCFAIGFAVGAVLVFTTIAPHPDLGKAEAELASSVVPPAAAAPAR